MSRLRIDMATIVVPDYEQALAFYRGALGFDLVEDSELGSGKRWVVVGTGDGARLLLAKASNDDQAAAVGRQAGGRVGFFLHTDDFATTHRAFTERGVTFEEQPRHEAYGTVAVFNDPFGNRWDLIEPKEAA